MGILVYFLLFAITFGELVRFSIVPGVEIKPLDLFVLLSIPLAISARKEILKNTSTRPFVLFIAVGLIGLGFNRFVSQNQVLISLLYLLRFVAIVLWYPLLAKRATPVRQRLVKMMTVSGIIITLLGFVQYLYYPSLKNLYYLGWDEHMYRLFSVFLDPNYCAAFLSIVFLMFLSQYFKNKSTLYAIFSVISLMALFLTYSRSGLIMLIVSTLVFLFLVGRKKILIPIFIFLILAIGVSSRYFYIENFNLFRTASSVARVASAQEAVSIFSKNPVIGVGFNAYKYAQIHYGYRQEKNAAKSHADGGTDNSFLLVLATTGVVGFSFYIWFWLTILRSKYVVFIKTNNIDQAMVIAIIIGIFIDALFINSLFYTPILLWIMILLGITENT